MHIYFPLQFAALRKYLQLRLSFQFVLRCTDLMSLCALDVVTFSSRKVCCAARGGHPPVASLAPPLSRPGVRSHVHSRYQPRRSSPSPFCPDDRYVIKAVSRVELVSFLDFGLSYFEYLTKAFFHQVSLVMDWCLQHSSLKSLYPQLPTILVKVLGLYRVKYINRAGRSVKQYLVVMENLFYDRTIARVRDPG